MADLPILYSPPMIRALLAGTKSQTRRANHLERLRRFGKIREFGRSDTAGYDWHFRDKRGVWNDLRHAELLKALPWHVGDRLWVREPVRAVDDQDTFDHQVEYLSDAARRTVASHGDVSSDAYGDWWNLLAYRSEDPDLDGGKDVPSIHMPRWVSRITQIVTDVRVQRLQDISEDDAIAEGCSRAGGGMFVIPGQYLASDATKPRTAISAVDAYGSLWRQINGPDTWDANPWVAAYTFTVHQQNISAMKEAA